MARYSSVSAKAHERVKLEGFRGIDTSSSQIDVEKYRATEMRNIISRNGQNRKRHGWKQELLNIDKGTTVTITYPNNFGGAVQGIYGFKFAGETETRVMVYANKKFWLKNAGEDFFKDITPSGIDTLKDRPCQFYLIGDALYIIGMGAFLVYDGNEIKNVVDNAYVPTNLINVISEEEKAKTTASIDSVVLEDINLLTSKFKVSLIGNDHEVKEDGVYETFNINRGINGLEGDVYNKSTGEYITSLQTNIALVDSSKQYQYYCLKLNEYDMIACTPLSSSNHGEHNVLKLKKPNAPDISLDLYFGKLFNGSLTLTIGNSENIISDDLDGDAFWITSNKFVIRDGYLILGADAGYTIEALDTQYLKVYGKETNFSNSDGTITGVFNNKGTIYFTQSIKDYEILLTCDTLNDYSARITDCAVSTLFGVNGHSDRLFVAGNPNTYGDWASNCIVQWSDIDNFTYFPDRNYTRLGTQATTINGMQRLNDDSLCLFKEASTTEPTIYVMYGEYGTDSEKNVTNVFRTYAGNVAEGLIAPNSTGNLAGDILMLSSNGVYGVELSENVVSTAKYTKERGLPIKRLIKEHTREELLKAYAIVRDDRYILCIADKCYVAESRYSYKPKGSPRDTFSYEWYIWDNIPALCFSEIDGELYFGTQDGRLCKFDNEFTDRKIDDFGAITIHSGIYVTDDVKGSLIVDKLVAIGDVIYVNDNTLYGAIGKSLNITYDTSKNTFTATADDKFLVEGEEFFTLSADKTLVIRYVVTSIDIEDNINITGTYEVVEGTASIKNGSYGIFYLLHNKPLIVTNPDKSPDTLRNQVTVSYNNKDIVYFERKNEKTNGYLATKSNVVSEWYSNVMDFGVPDYSKTLLGFTVVPEKVEGDSVAFGYITREVDNQHDVDMIRKNLHQVTDSPLNFENLAFFPLALNSFQNSYTKKVKVRNFNYLMWFFRSDSPTDSAIDNVVFEYKINHKNKGVN